MCQKSASTVKRSTAQILSGGSWRHKVVRGLAPGYLGPFHTCRRPTQSTIAAFCLYQQTCRLLVAELYRSPARRHGMTSRKTWYQQNHWSHFVVSSRHTSSGSIFLTTCWTSTDCLRWTLIAVVSLLRPSKNYLFDWLIASQIRQRGQASNCRLIAFCFWILVFKQTTRDHFAIAGVLVMTTKDCLMQSRRLSRSRWLVTPQSHTEWQYYGLDTEQLHWSRQYAYEAAHPLMLALWCPLSCSTSTLQNILKYRV